MTETEGRPQPLSRFHRHRDRAAATLNPQYYSDLFCANLPWIRELLLDLIAGADRKRDRHKLLRSLFPQAVSPDGKVVPASTRQDENGSGVELNDLGFQSVDAFVDAALLPIQFAFDPELMLSEIGSLPQLMPLISGLCHNLIYGLLRTHELAPARPDSSQHPATGASTLNLHVHWGATQMAGFPPAQLGYISRNVDFFRLMLSRLIKVRGGGLRLHYVLAPAVIFTLIPNEAYPTDCALVEALFDDLASFGPPVETDGGRMDQLREHVRAWRRQRWEGLSTYYKANFGPVRCMLAPGTPQQGGYRVSESFLNLTFAEACQVVSAFHEPL